jgi:hypothetical protein
VQDSGQLIAELARAIRSYLAGLVDDGEVAARLDAELAGLLAETGSPSFQADVLEAVGTHAATRDWAAAFLESGAPPDVAPQVERGYAAPPGRGVVAVVARYVCPEGDYVRWRRAAGMELEPCPTHGLDLVPG